MSLCSAFESSFDIIDELLPELYFNICQDVLIRELPLARGNLQYIDGTIRGTDNFAMACNKLRKGATFFMFFDYEFYKQVKIGTQELEDMALDMDNYDISKKEYYEKLQILDRKTKVLYEYVFKKCVNW